MRFLQYRYVLNNLEKLSESDLDNYKLKISKLSVIKNADITNQDIIIEGQEGVYEYDILQSLIEASDEFGVEVVFDGDQPLDNQAPLNEEDLEDNPAYTNEEFIDFNDKLSESKKSFKKDSYFRLGELCLSIVLFIVSLFFELGNSVFSAKMILLIISYSISGYDIVFNFGMDIYKKKFFAGNIAIVLSSIALVLLGEPTTATLMVILFAIAKFIEQTAEKKRGLKIEELFYTGSTPVIANGVNTLRGDIKQDDILSLKAGDIIPCDGVLLKDGEVYSYPIDYNMSTDYKAGDDVLGGSVTLSEVSVKAKCKFGESFIDTARDNFKKSINQIGGDKYKKYAKIGLYADLALLLVALITTFVLPCFSSTYKIGLVKWGLVGACILAVGTIVCYITNIGALFGNLWIDGKSSHIDFKDPKYIFTLAKANSLIVSAKSICDCQKPCLKDDTTGALNELFALGIKKAEIKKDFDGADVVDIIKFNQDNVKKENLVFVGDGEGDVGLKGGKVNIMNGEISFVPLAYKMAKTTNSKVKISCIVGAILKVVLIALLFVIPYAKFNIVWFAVIGALLNLLVAGFSLPFICKK